MIGHEKIIADLKGLHSRGALSHGYIFYGPAMVGKRTLAVAFANFLESGTFGEPAGTLGDLMVIDSNSEGSSELRSSIGIDAVREIRNFLWQKPNASPRRTLIIDDADLLTMEAQNALLKITEEPPPSSLLILVTSDIESILPTIASRLPKLYFGTISERDIAAWLGQPSDMKKKKPDVAPGFAKKAMGKPGLAWRLLHDEIFQKNIESAERLLKAPAASRREAIKKIIEPDDFNFRKFLDAMVIVLAWQGPIKARPTLWHKTLALYERQANFALNPRLQLENLLI